MKPFPHSPRFPDANFRRCSFWVMSLALIILVILKPTPMGQQMVADSLEGSTVCTFESGEQVSARYKPVAARNEEVPTGKVWAPGGLAMTLFTEAEVAIGGTSIPAGAYTMYLLPGKKDWVLIVSRNVMIDGKYDQSQDVVRATMQTGELGQFEGQLKVFIGHLGAKRCEIDVDYGKNKAWIDLTQK